MDTVLNSSTNLLFRSSNNEEMSESSSRENTRLISSIKKRLPLTRWLATYHFSYFLQDLLAGFTVGLTEIPQSIAYAIVAGLPSEYGLYSGIAGCFIYFLLGSVMVINLGPTAIMALMVQPHVAKMGIAGAILITFLTGCIIFISGLMKLGFIVECFSYPVIAGFTTAAAINIASTQLKSVFGIKIKTSNVLEAITGVIEHIREAREWDTILALATIAFLVFAREIRRYGTLKVRPDWSKRRNIFGIVIFMLSLSSNAIAVIFGSTLAYYFAQKGLSPFILTGYVSGGLPPFTLPPFSTNFNGTYFSFGDMMSEYGSTVIFCPLVSVLEHIAISKAFTKGKTLDASQEFFALGFCNIVASFFLSMPITGSFTRTAVNNASGAKTPICGIITGIMAVLALNYLTNSFKYIPKCTLASVIIVAMYYLCDFKAFSVLWKTKKLDLIPMIVTIVCCISVSLEFGILVGIATNITFVLYSSARPKIEIEKRSNNFFIVSMNCGLHFTAAQYLKEYILEHCNREKTTVIIDGKYMSNIDATVVKSIDTLKEELAVRNQELVLCNFTESIKQRFLGVNKNLANCFTNDNVEEVMQTHQVPSISVD